MTLDNPHVRNGMTCPLCDKVKPIGPVVCWSCYGRFGLRYGNSKAEAIITKAERLLTITKRELGIGETFSEVMADLTLGPTP